MRVLRKKGLIYKASELLLLFTDVAKVLKLNSWLRSGILSLIRFYQVNISPHKGFSCAYKYVYGDCSCSQFFRQSLENKSLKQSILLFQQRLIACKQANQLLINCQLEKKKRSSNYDNCNCNDLDFINPCLDCDSNCNGTPDCLEPNFDCGGCDCG